MNFEFAVALGRTVRKNVVRPPAFKISAAPNGDALEQRKLERAIDPSATGPARRSDRPVRMIIERNQNKRLGDPAKPERGQIMKIARAVKIEWRNALGKFAIKTFNQARWGAKPQTRAPLARINGRETKGPISPSVVEVQMNCDAQNDLFGCARLKPAVALFCGLKNFAHFCQSWIDSEGLLVLHDRLTGSSFFEQ